MCKSDTKWHAKWRHQVRLSPQSAMKMVQYLLLATPPLLTTLPYRTTPPLLSILHTEMDIACYIWQFEKRFKSLGIFNSEFACVSSDSMDKSQCFHIGDICSKVAELFRPFFILILYVYHQTDWIRCNISTLVTLCLIWIGIRMTDAPLKISILIPGVTCKFTLEKIGQCAIIASMGFNSKAIWSGTCSSIQEKSRPCAVLATVRLN